jgi:hypothetical protein
MSISALADVIPCVAHIYPCTFPLRICIPPLNQCVEENQTHLFSTYFLQYGILTTINFQTNFFAYLSPLEKYTKKETCIYK